MRYFIITTSFYIILPALLGCLLFNKLKIEFKILTIYLIIFSLVEGVGHFLGLQKINTLFLIHIFSPIELILYTFIFNIHFQNWLPKNIIPIGLIIFTTLSILNSIFIQPINTFPTYFLYLEFTTLILLSLTYFYQVFTELKVEKLWEDGMFWFSTGLLFYYSGTMILFLSSNYLNKTYPDAFAFFYSLVQGICHLLIYSLFIVAIWMGRKKSI